MNESGITIDRERLQTDLERTGRFGAIDAASGRGRTALTGSEANRRGREYLCERLADAGLAVSVDAVGNVTGTWLPDSADPDAAPVAAGSHLDSVPEGGIFDGPLGVYAALESVRAISEAGITPERPIVVVSFSEEEGQRFGEGLLGSSVATGRRTVEEALSLPADDGIEDGVAAGTTLETALERIGFRGEGRLDAADWNAFLELHVEQDRRLERAGVPVGVVRTVTGITQCSLRIEGEADHAGATPMNERTDALAAASEAVLAVERAANDVVASESETAVGTVGRCTVTPGATNVVPGAVELGVDVRDVRRPPMESIVERTRAHLAMLERERGVETTFERLFDLDPAPMADRCRDAIEDAADAAGIPALDLHSGAAHDAMHVARVTDAGMLFAPSRDGVSHSPREWTDWEDCATATRVLAGALARLSGASRDAGTEW